MKNISKILFAAISFLVGAFLFYFLTQIFDMSIPSPLIAVLVLPLTYCLQAIYKLSDLKESQQLTGSEVRRLFYLIDIKRARLFTCVIFYIISASFVAVLMMISNGGSTFKVITISISGGILGVTIYTVFIIYSLMNEISNFKAKIIIREQEEKSKKMD